MCCRTTTFRLGELLHCLSGEERVVVNRQGVSKERREGHSTIPITVRQLEAITRWVSVAFRG